MDIGIWSEELSGQRKIVPLADLQLRNVALGENIKDASERTVLKLTHMKPVASEDDGDDEPTTVKTTTVLCALLAGKIEQYSCQISLFENEEYTFEVVGENTVYLTGNYITHGQSGVDSDLDSDEDEYDLRDVSSDVELDMAGLDPAEIDSDGSRFEEIQNEPPKTSKRQRESDTTNGDAAASKDEPKVQKKLKKEDGKAVTTKAEGEQKEQKSKKDKKKEKKGDKQGNVREIVGGIKVKDAKTGTGPQAKKGDTVLMRYIGKFEDDNKVFDKNTTGKPFSFKLGKGEVIKGWDEGIVGMQVGGERSLTIPGPMAYGKKPPSGIPPNATLIFDVKLLEIRK